MYFLKGAKPSVHEKGACVHSGFDPAIKVNIKAGTVFLEIALSETWSGEGSRDLVTTRLLGKATVPALPYKKPDGSDYRIDTDYFGRKRDVDNPFPGPFAFPGKGVQSLKLWPKW